HLRREGHEVTVVEKGEDGLAQLDQANFDLVALDWMLPGLSGLDICKKIRMNSNAKVSGLPVVMLTARAHATDIVLGLEMGADDYVTKPFEIPVFLARVRALLRRSQGETVSEQGDKYEIGELKVDSSSYQVGCGKKDIQLTPSEFRLLLALVKNRGRVLTRERLIDLVQGEGVTVVDRTIDTHIFGLRKKLGKCSDVVETIRGVGYRVKAE
ncbi:MAG: response regulator transcription factor, partial [Verrucomicrobiales bacterium]